MQERGGGRFFVEAVLGGEIKHIDAAQRAIGRFSNRTLDGGNAIGIGRLPEHTEEGFDLAHVNAPSNRTPPGLKSKNLKRYQYLRRHHLSLHLCDDVSNGAGWLPTLDLVLQRHQTLVGDDKTTRQRPGDSNQ